MTDVLSIAPSLLKKLNQRIPRYTSYPTAPFFTDFSSSDYAPFLQDVKEPLSLYIHIPFCRKMCLFCACSVIINRNEERQQKYVDTLLQEIQHTASFLPEKGRVIELHFGGGTPTNLTEKQFEKIFSQLEKTFSFDPNIECSIEIDPRTVLEKKSLKYLKTRFQRVSFGVQDLDLKVQEAVKRRQSKEMSEKVFFEARSVGFSSINIDLIYGLPEQSVESFSKTSKLISDLKPDRIALFSYAKVPFLKPHQKAIREDRLPKEEEKFAIYKEARKNFLEGGYLGIGMDHFARKEDPLAKAYEANMLYRNFQGYSVKKTPHMLGFGVSSISFLRGVYAQNTKDLAGWQKAVQEKKLPVTRGKVLSENDQKRHRIIQEIMCRFSYTFTDKELEEFSLEIHRLYTMKALVFLKKNQLQVTPLGKLFIRNVAAVFDEYLKVDEKKRYSTSI